jgi:chromosome segregation ATPase
MVDANQTRQFTFGAPDDDLPPAPDDDINVLRFRKVNRRITWLAILLPILTALMGVFGYLEIEKRLINKESIGNRELEGLSVEINDRIASLSARIDEAEENLAQSLSTWQKQTESAVKGLETELDTAQKALQKIDVTAAVGAVEQKQKALSEDVSKKLNPLIQRMDAISEDIKSLDARLSEQLASLSDMTEKHGAQINAAKTLSESLKKSQLNREQLDLELLKVKKAYQLQLEREISILSQKLNTLAQSIEQLESRPTSQRRAPQSSLAVPPPSDDAAPSSGGIRETPLQ